MARLDHPLIKYFGSKWKGCRYYPEPRYQTIVEPFCGSACYSCHYPEHAVELYDIDPEVAALMGWLVRDATPELIRGLPTHELPEGLDLRELLRWYPLEACDLIRRWQRIGHCSTWTVSSWNNRPGMWNDKTRESVAASLARIRHWQVAWASYEQILIRRPACTWFIDPPYWVPEGAPKRGGYAFEQIDYDHLAAWCRKLPGQVIVCEQEGATWLPFRPSHEITGIKRRVHHAHANGGREMVWLSDWERTIAA